LVQVQCPRCSFNFLVQTESGAKDVYTVCPNCSNTVPLAGQIVTPPPSQRLRPASAGPVFMAAGVLIVMAALQILVLPLFCGILLLGSSFVIALLAAGTPALREDSYRSRMAILAFGTCLGVYLAVTLKIFLTRTLEVMLYTYAFFVMAPFFALILLPGPIPRRFRDELAVAGGVFLSLTGGAIAFLPGLLPWTQYDAPIWMILGLSAFLYGYESARPVENMSQLIFAGVGAAIIVLVGAAVWQSIESISIQEALVTVMWAALGVLLISIRLIPSMRGHRLEEVLVFTLPLGLGVLFVLFGILVLMQQLYAEGSLELAVGIPLILWGVSQFSRSRWKMWVGILAYVVVLELLSFWTLLWAPR
ncbi:MAG: hypothetical protein ACE5IJ_06955, partial [Thermoplasmata archaeon]